MDRSEQPRCDHCGQFIGMSDIISGKAKQDFTPDNAFGPERIEWLCAACAEREQNSGEA